MYYLVLLHFRDRFRTTVNVCGDCFGAGLVEYLSRNDLKDSVPQNCVVLNSRNEMKDASLLSVENADGDLNTML